ncbi:SSS family solute:Na+ symporter [Melghirimyces profundicolus]|uniref:SSS family solute:Na+ symporter n=1 Tax=Melghirimyces profundicolus TaxID=1242148 RepID=A0A2T6C8F2_9BACL|nr:sodium:solute symporter family protein [Melghirimyces profundicolus]PTX64594.1 SSS family solute:Na+ symporter [Melghirimyces profundicolus]
MNLSLLIGMVIVYLGVMSWLAFLGNRQTRTAEDYLVAGRNVHPAVMALSYGATMISTSAIIGFGGAAAVFGFGLLWLAFLNIVVGIFVAFAIFGVRLRKMSQNLDATTFPTLLGKRYHSKFIAVFSGLMIFLFMPAYTSIVLIGGGRFLQETLKVDYNIGLLLLAVIVALYVITGGLKGVMYTDAFAGLVMLFGMILLLFSTYYAVGGVVDGHQGLSAMKDQIPPPLVEQGHQGWTSMPALGSPLWWTLISTLVMGVGIGVLAQPQLAMRSMTVRGTRSLYRSVLIGGVFMFFMTGTAFMVGPISNLYFHETQGKIAIAVAEGNSDLIMPIFINRIMPEWFLYLFTLTLLSAAISTISSLIHVQGTAFSEDILRNLNVSREGRMNLSRIGVLVGIVAAVILAYILPGSVIAQATAFWFGICAAGFLPALVGALYWRNATQAGAAASIVTGFGLSIFGFLFLHQKEAAAFGLAKALFGKETLLPYPWTHVDPLFYALPISAVVFGIVSWLTRTSVSQIQEQVRQGFAGVGTVSALPPIKGQGMKKG